MRRFVLTLAALAVPSQALAQADCYRAGFGPYGSQVPAWMLAMNKPTVKALTLQSQPALLKKGLALAVQEYSVAPRTRYLAAPITLLDDKGKPLANAVPLEAGAPITTWRGADGERLCSIGWKSGPLGGGFGHYRWVCFEDKDRDGKLDQAWLPRTKNLGFSYKRFDMAISPQVALLDQPPAAAAPSKARGPLDSYPAYRRIELNGLTPKQIKLRYRGAGLAGADIEVPLDQPKVIKLGGIDLTLAKNAANMWVISAAGDFEPQPMSPICDGTSWMIGTFDSRVMFSFPDW
ncbi:MAG: hypothetical protein RL299_2220 [Pseudomonadota bacterium]|jgi:hypothetical protein